MKNIFTIGARPQEGGTLILEIGDDHFAEAIFNKAGRNIEFLSYTALEDREAEDQVVELLRNTGQAREEVLVGSAFGQALLLPETQGESGEGLVPVLFDLQDDILHYDKVCEWQIRTEYSIPEKIDQALRNQFPTARLMHTYSAALHIYNGFVAGEQINLHFSPRYFRVLVKKTNAIQLVQTYSYKTPLDVVYFLLKICYEMKLDQSQLFLVVSGLIEQDSALYKELHHYFLNLHFAAPVEIQLPENEYPQYYFTSLYNLAACAS